MRFTGEWAGLDPTAYWPECRFSSLADLGSVTYLLCDLKANYVFVFASASSSEMGCVVNEVIFGCKARGTQLQCLKIVHSDYTPSTGLLMERSQLTPYKNPQW